MANKTEKDMFDEFDFMYRHKNIVKEQERIKAEEEAEKAALEAKEKAEKAALLLKEEQKPNKKDIKKPEKKKKPAKKPPEKVKKEEKPKESTDKKVHPAYAKPYKNDRPSDRKRADTKKRAELEKKYKREEKQNKKAKRKQEKVERTAAIKAALTRFSVYALISFGAAAVIFGISFGVTRFLLGFRRGVDHKSISYQVGLVSDTVRVPYNDLIRDGVLYVCGNDIVNLCGFTVTGSDNEIKYISPDDGNDTVMFYKGTNIAVVNNNEIRLEADTYEIDKKLYIPVSFFTSYSTGLVFDYTPETEENRASLKVYKNILNEYDHRVTGNSAVYEPVAFRIKEFKTLESLDENSLKDEIEDATYKVDVTAYYDAINPQQIFGYISVINKDHRALSTIQYGDLTQVCIQSESVEEPIMLRSIAARALEAMFSEVRGVEGYERFNVYSGYHTYEDSALTDPSLDESLLGLSVEVYFNPKEDFGGTNTYKWFVNNAYKYGFIIRYPKDKTEVTGVSFRPWVLRYVGRYAATKMRNENLCLEEFIEKYNLERVLEIKKTS